MLRMALSQDEDSNMSFDISGTQLVATQPADDMTQLTDDDEEPAATPEPVWGELVALMQDLQFVRLKGDRIVLGRSKSCDVVLRDNRVSSRHCAIFRVWQADSGVTNVFIEDSSVNGTYLNGVKVPKGRSIGGGGRWGAVATRGRGRGRSV